MREQDQLFLTQLMSAHGGVAGTVHRREGELLVISAAVNIPPPVVEVTRHIPFGKGMAGLAWQRQAPVQTCNLKDDGSGDVRPGAKAVDAAAAVALPLNDGSGVVRAVVGVAFAEVGELPPERVQALWDDARTLPPG